MTQCAVVRCAHQDENVEIAAQQREVLDEGQCPELGGDPPPRVLPNREGDERGRAESRLGVRDPGGEAFDDPRLLQPLDSDVGVRGEMCAFSASARIEMRLSATSSLMMRRSMASSSYVSAVPPAICPSLLWSLTLR